MLRCINKLAMLNKLVPEYESEYESSRGGILATMLIFARLDSHQSRHTSRDQFSSRERKKRKKKERGAGNGIISQKVS